MKKLYVADSAIAGKGIFAAEPIKAHEHISFIKGERKFKVCKDKQDSLNIKNWYGVTESEFIDPNGNIWEYFNHSCDPNTAIVGTRKLIALKPIRKDTEITFDYSMSDGDLLWELEYDCACGAKNCRKKIYPIQLVPEEVFQARLPYVPKYFVKLRKKYLASLKLREKGIYPLSLNLKDSV